MGVGGSVMGYWECMGQGVSNLSKCCTSNGNDDKMNSVLDRMKSCCGSESPDEAEGKSKTKRRTFKANALMAFLQRRMLHDNIPTYAQKKYIHPLDVTNIPPTIIDRTLSGDVLEFKVNGRGEYDIFQVRKNGDDYFRMNMGLEIWNINKKTPVSHRCIPISFALDEGESEMDIYFCVISSSNRKSVLEEQTCPKIYCEKNHFVIEKRTKKISLTDEAACQKITLCQGDTIEVDWLSAQSTGYHIEEKKYCPISGGVYSTKHTIEDHGFARYFSRRNRPICDSTCNHDETGDTTLSEAKYKKEFNELGMSFLFRWNNKIRLHDIIVCVINDKPDIRHIKLNDDNIPRDIIVIEQNDWVFFEWDIEGNLNVAQIQSFHVFESQEKPIRLRNVGKNYLQQNGSRYCGSMYHQFSEAGIYNYEIANQRIGTIYVIPRKNIKTVELLSDQLIHTVKTTDLVQFKWTTTGSEEKLILITLNNPDSLIVENACIPNRVFNFSCCMHKCKQTELLFYRAFHACEAFILNIPQHGLYNFAYGNTYDTVLISLIVEKAIQTHFIHYDANNMFEPHTITINRFDQVLFCPLSTSRTGTIYQTDEYGDQLEPGKKLVQPQKTNMNYFMINFTKLGIHYFSMDIKARRPLNRPLAIIVLPEVIFHHKVIRNSPFDSEIILTNTNDFVIWEFEHDISHDFVRLKSNETLEDIRLSSGNAINISTRRCLGVSCKELPFGASFFSNPDFDRLTDSSKDPIISTVIVDPFFSQNCFHVTNRQFIPDILCIAKNDTVSWIFADGQRNHRIHIYSNKTGNLINDDSSINRNISEYVDGIDHLHTFSKEGEYTIKSDHFQHQATVVVYSNVEERKIHCTKICDMIHPLTLLGTKVRLDCPSYQNAVIYYTLDGKPPTRPDMRPNPYDLYEAVRFREQGLKVLRAYSRGIDKISSCIKTSSPTLVVGNEKLSIETQPKKSHANKIHVKIKFKPIHSVNLVDHFALYINGVEQKRFIPKTDNYFSIDGLSANKQHKIHIVAYPKDFVVDAEPIPSNKLIFMWDQDIRGGMINHGKILSDDFKDRARILYEKLTEDIENREKKLNSSAMPLHVLNSGCQRYLNREHPSQRSSVSYFDPRRDGRQLIKTVELGNQWNLPVSDSFRCASTEITLFTEQQDYRREKENSSFGIAFEILTTEPLVSE